MCAKVKHNTQKFTKQKIPKKKLRKTSDIPEVQRRQNNWQSQRYVRMYVCSCPHFCINTYICLCAYMLLNDIKIKKGKRNTCMQMKAFEIHWTPTL